MCLKKKKQVPVCWPVGTCSNPGRTLTGGYRAEELCGESRWPSWAPVPNKPTVSVDVKPQFN